jgi:mycothiol synthase
MKAGRSTATVVARPYRNDQDWWLVRELLVETFGAVRPGFNWEIRRWDGWRFHREEPARDKILATQVGLWEDESGHLLGAVHPEGPGEAYLEVRPEFRSIEPEMVAWAEAYLSVDDGWEARHVDLWIDDDDEARRSMLTSCGYRMLDAGGWLRWLRFAETPPAEPDVAAPYVLRPTQPTESDYAGLANLLNRAFGRSIHTAREYRTFAENSPSFDHELNLVAVDPEGTLAAHAGITYDAANRYGIVEPVCTDPDHRRHGLAQALIVEGLRRLRGLGAEVASVETGDGAAANALYESCGFKEAHHSHAWRREF